jgi:hypothetical protein
MKKSLIALLTLTTLSAFADVSGLPSEDPVVKSLRERFETARAPLDSELLGKSFKCKEMKATKGDFAKYSFSENLIFSQFDGLLVSHQQDSKMNGQHLVNSGAELIGSTGRPQFMSYRMDENGFLIGEWTGAKSDKAILEPITRGLPESQRVVSYKICVHN